MTEAAGAARAVAAILRHAAAERDGLVSVRTDGDELVMASPGETSLLMARLPLPGDGLDGSFAPPTGDPPKDAEALTLSAARTGLAVQLGRRRLTLRRIADAPVEVEWVWPATAPVEAVVSRDRLLEALPAGEGRITFVGADRQLLVQAGRGESRVPLKNRTRRRKDIGTAVAFDELRRLVEAAGADVTIELADLRPLTIVSGHVRGVVVRGMPMRWQGRPAVATKTAEPPSAPSPKAAPRRRDAAAERAAERAARKREAERLAAARARDVKQAQQALGRAVAQLDAASEALAKLDDADLSARADQLRAALRDLLARCGDAT